MNARLLFIEPRQPATLEPTVDHLTRTMCGAFRKARRSDYVCAGFHMCFCGVPSTSCDYILPDGSVTNSLCIHYLAHHRLEVPEEQLARVTVMDVPQAEPSEGELSGPKAILAGIRAMVAKRLGASRLATWRSWGLNDDALCRGLQGGCLPAPMIFTEARQEAEDLFAVLCAVAELGLARIQQSAQRSHGNMNSWGSDALRLPGWRREPWVRLLVDLLQHAQTDRSRRRIVAMAFRHLGADAKAAIPALRQLADAASGDYRSDVLLALAGIK